MEHFFQVRPALTVSLPAPFVPSQQNRRFKDAPVGKILNVEEPTPGHFYWPELDVDLGIESIEHPERFPLKAKNV